MSVSIRWAPANDGRSLGYGGSSVYEALQEIFGPQPMTLTMADVKTLRAMAKASGFEDCRNAYKTLADLVEKHEMIKVWGEW